MTASYTTTASNGSATAPARLSALERLETLFDRDTLQPLRSGVRSEWMGAAAEDGDGVLAAAGRIGGRPSFAFAEDGRFAGGSLGQAHADTIVRVLELAGRARIPVVGFIESAGARMQEGPAALAGYARVFRANVALSGSVPQVSIVSGTSAGGACYSAALTDFVVMTRSASMFLTGPKVVEEVTREETTPSRLGGPRVHERNGVCDFVADDDVSAATLARHLLGHLPQSTAERPPRALRWEPPTGHPSACVPSEAARTYDVREVVSALVDDCDGRGRGTFLELAPKWARNIVTGLARIEGQPVGIVANQARYLGGVIDCEASQKAAGFVNTCNRFGIPLVVLVDTPGFMPGMKQEAAGVIRHGAGLLRAFCQARVPKLTVVLRKAYGGGYITMNSADLGADYMFAWPQACIGVMGASQAVGVTHRLQIATAEDPETERAQLAARYAEEHVAVRVAATGGYVDELIEPHETRARLALALAVLATKAPLGGAAS